MKRNNFITCLGICSSEAPLSNLVTIKEVYSISVSGEHFLKSPNKKEMSRICRSLSPIVSPSHATLPIQQPNEDSCSFAYKFCISKVERRLNAVFVILRALVFRETRKGKRQDEMETWLEFWSWAKDVDFFLFLRGLRLIVQRMWFVSFAFVRGSSWSSGHC